MQSPAQTSQTVQDLILKEETSAVMMQGIESILLAIVLLSVLYIAIKYVFSRINQNASSVTERSTLKVVEAKRLTRKSTALVVEWHAKQYLLVESSQGVTLIDEAEQALKQES